MTERVMARIVKIDAISAIPDADQIETAHIGGWKVVVKKGEFTEGSLACYVEIDAWVPHSIAPFLTEAGKFPKVYNNVEGQRLKSKKIRKVISQGLLLPLTSLFPFMDAQTALQIKEGDDVSEVLGIQKWEPPSEFRAANAKGNFPHFIPKTDCERVQNLSREVQQWAEECALFQQTEKLDGSSMTVFIKDGEVGVCSRNLELKDDGSTTFWEVAKKQGLIEALEKMQGNYALQGELLGGQIQGNAYKISDFKFFLYDIFDIDKQEFITPEQVEKIAKGWGIQHVPVLGYITLTAAENKTIVETLLESANGVSQVGIKPKREGFVLKHPTDTRVSVKVISNSWLLKNEG